MALLQQQERSFCLRHCLKKVAVTTSEIVAKLEDWQMYMCRVPPQGWGEMKIQTAVDILMRNYNPDFKLHFYIISDILILSIVSSVMTLFMHIGEMILLYVHLYRFGKGFIFNSILDIAESEKL